MGVVKSFVDGVTIEGASVQAGVVHICDRLLMLQVCWGDDGYDVDGCCGSFLDGSTHHSCHPQTCNAPLVPCFQLLEKKQQANRNMLSVWHLLMRKSFQKLQL